MKVATKNTNLKNDLALGCFCIQKENSARMSSMYGKIYNTELCREYFKKRKNNEIPRNHCFISVKFLKDMKRFHFAGFCAKKVVDVFEDILISSEN